ncbi:Ubiquitin carboxyl-terminal hydrolase MINDY-3-like protein [Frankliniella fusca]|uniref:Ubiquitin carboxyl-terminal hydrolase MINDY n=1 Tax=Frankliniella fusca TaxID=407009 RepID=A0AAE1H126_9NEOP|nr:Ubiquitin carboxyl-terminal hydrolase MINDY-3-like protein [Frankliniella fusca]
MKMDKKTPSVVCKEVQDISNILWGPSLKIDVFRRWAQGFHFSNEEPTALLQCEGGPCAVLAPVQAFIIKTLLETDSLEDWRKAGSEKCNKLLVKAVCDILSQVKEEVDTKFQLFELCNAEDNDDPDMSCENTPSQSNLTNGSMNDDSKDDLRLIESSISLRQNLSADKFHSQLRVITVDNIAAVEAFYNERISMLQNTYGVLLLLYSVICSKGIEQISEEMSDPSESLIDIIHGYGNQSLINLMLTGRAVGHVWDHEQDVGGLKLRGLIKQNEVGFLALFEHLRYCEVGSFFKNPKHPVWVVGSETHLTVLFSWEKSLVSPETAGEVARRVFKRFDPDGNNFIQSSSLQDVLHELNLVSETEYVEIMRRKLDPEGLGIILLSAFMDEFYSDEKRTTPDVFTLFHYNGLPHSCPDGRVVYQEGSAVLLESDVQCVFESNQIQTVLQTKWRNIEVNWKSGGSPSLN